MKNVLFIVYYFPPMGGSGVQRPLKFVKYLRDFGWNPIVLCPEPGAYHIFDDSLHEELLRMNVEVHRIKGKTPFHTIGNKKTIKLPNGIEEILRKVSTFFWIPDNKKGWIEPAYKEALKLIEKKDVEAVFSTAAPFSNLLIAAKLKTSLDIPVIMDLRDEWLESHLTKYPTKWHRNRIKEIEQEVLPKADIITVVNEPYKASFGRRFPEKDIRVLRQGFDPEDFPNKKKRNKASSKLTFLYSGIFYGKRKPDLFLEAIHELIKENPSLRNEIELQFQGGLDEESISLIEKLNVSDIVENLGYVEHKTAVKNLSKADILWLLIGHTKDSEKVTLGKMFEYFGSGKPILALAPEGGTRELLKQYNASYYADPYSKSEIKSVLGGIISDYKNQAQPKVNETFIEQYNRKKLAGELATYLDEKTVKE